MNVLVLCTGNSARSILAEVLINELGRGRFRAFSAGSHPAGKVNPGALDKLERAGHPTRGLASKSWDEFSGHDAQPINLVITVCDNAAGESCPVWNGSPLTVHWGIPDPAAITESDDAIRKAFDLAYERLRSRITALVELDPDEIDREKLAGIHEQALQEQGSG